MILIQWNNNNRRGGGRGGNEGKLKKYIFGVEVIKNVPAEKRH